MDPDLTEQISQLKKTDRVSLSGLIDCATQYLSTNGSSTNCLSISFLGSGSYNNVYRLVFGNNIQLAGCVSRRSKEKFNALAKQSEIDTMKFVRDSGLYPDIPIPKVHAWDTTFDNLVGAPYVLMDVIEGTCFQGIRDENLLFGFDTLNRVKQLSVIKELAKLQAALSKPLPFDKIGCLIADHFAGGDPSVGPFMTPLSPTCLGGPYESIQQLWRSLLERGMLHAVEEWCNHEKDSLSTSVYIEPNLNPHTFAEVFQLLSSLIPHFNIPKAYNALVLHHPDIALRNIIFDKESFLTDQPKIIGLIDWGGAQILPLMLTAHYPDDLISSGDNPLVHPTFSMNEDWRQIPFDWTCIGDRKDWPEVYMAPDKPINQEPRLAAMVRRFYLRAYFSACFAEQMHLIHGDATLSHGTLFADATYYLKFHEIMMGGWSVWLQHTSWIRETYWRLRTLGGQTAGGEILITGPNIYRSSVERSLIDLRISEELPPVEINADGPDFDD